MSLGAHSNWRERAEGIEEDNRSFAVDLALDLYWPGARAETAEKATDLIVRAITLGKEVVEGYDDDLLGQGGVLSKIEIERRLRSIVTDSGFDDSEDTFERNMRIAGSLVEAHIDMTLIDEE